MAYPFFSLAKTHRVTPIEFVAGDVSIRVEAVADHGMATIWDADILIWAASQIVEARDTGLRTSRLMVATPYDSEIHRARHVAARLPAPESRAGPPSVHHRQHHHPPAGGRATTPLLVYQ